MAIIDALQPIRDDFADTTLPTKGAALVGDRARDAAGAALPASFGATVLQTLQELPLDLVNDFHAPTDGVTDARPAIQAGLDAAIAAGVRHLRIRVPHMTFVLNDSIIVGQKNVGGTDWNTVLYVTFEAEAPGAVFKGNFNDRAVFVIQRARYIQFENITFQGQNDISGAHDFNAVNTLMPNANYLLAGVRNNRYSPHAGVVIDPYSNTVAAGNQYPGQSANYIGPAGGGGSGEISFVRCTFTQVACGCLISANPDIANGEDIYFDRCNFDGCHCALGIGLLQDRNVTMSACQVNRCLWMTSGNIYGFQNGPPPNIFGCDVGEVKYLFDNRTDWGGAVIHGLYCERVMSLGRVAVDQGAGYPVHFAGCTFQFGMTTGTQKGVDALGFLLGPCQFAGCKFNFVGAGQPAHFFNSDKHEITFLSCSVQGIGTNASQDLRFSSPGSVRFISCELYDNVTGVTGASHAILSDRRRFPTPLSFTAYRQVMLPGTLFQLGGDAALYVSRFEDPQSQLFAGALTVTNNTASFTPGIVGLARVGDVIVRDGATPADFPGSYNSAYTGRVSAVGATITIDMIPESLVSGNPNLRVSWLPRYHPDTTGNLTSGNNQVTNVSQPTAWGVGDRIRGTGITDGTWIQNISGTTFTLSTNASASATAVRLYDADWSALALAAAAQGLIGSKTWDPPLILSGDEWEETVTVTGAVVGDLAMCSFSLVLPQGVFFAQPEVTAANTVTVKLLNHSLVDQDIASGTLRAMVWKGS